MITVRAAWFVCAVLALAPPAASAQQNRVEAIQARGFLSCAVWPEVQGFATVDSSGHYRGFDIDICRAVAAALLGSPDHVQWVNMRTAQEFLAAPGVDLASRRLTWSLAREGQSGFRFGPVTFYDGQGFLVPRRLGIRRLRQLSGRRICVEPGSPAEFNVGPAFSTNHLVLEQVLFPQGADLAAAFASGRCEAYTADVTMLASIRTTLAGSTRYDILSELVSKEPLAPVVRQQDERLFDVVRWTIFSLINAEEMGITSANVDKMRESPRPDIRRLLGSDAGNGAALGLREEWAYDAIKAVGNYGEIYERHVGLRTAIGLPRGVNRLWTAGGLMWAPPAR